MPEKVYKLLSIPKGNGKFREIYNPSSEYKKYLQNLIPSLTKTMKTIEKHNVSFGFMEGRNCVQNAQCHIGNKYVLSMDLKNFFDSVTIDMFLEKGWVNIDVLESCFIDGVARQGLPTSPILANMVFSIVDNEIIESLKKLGINCTYSRYADDLTFSYNDAHIGFVIVTFIPNLVKKYGFEINNKKTKFQNIANGRVIITGVAIDTKKVYPTRKSKRKLRAMLHKNNEIGARGMLEWIKCKEPN